MLSTLLLHTPRKGYSTLLIIPLSVASLMTEILDNFSCFCCRLLIFFFKINFFFSEIPSVATTLDSDQDRHVVGPYLGPNYLQRLSADDKFAASRLRVNDRNVLSMAVLLFNEALLLLLLENLSCRRPVYKY